MVHAPNRNFSPLPVGKCGESTKQSTRRHHQANAGNRSFPAERVGALGALHSSRSKKKLSAEKGRETHILNNEVTEKGIEDSVERETTVARKRVQDAETAIIQQLKDMTTAECVGATTRMPEATFEKMLNAIGECLSDPVSSDDEQDGEDEKDDEQDTELGKLSDDDEPGWVMGTLSKTVQHRMESFQQKQMRIDEMTKPGWVDAANSFHERDMKYCTAELKLPAVVKPPIDSTAAKPPLKTFGEHMHTLDDICGQSQMPAVTSRPGCNQMRLGSEKPQLQKLLPKLWPMAAPNLTPIQDAKPVEPMSVYPCIKYP